jgi:rhodanese-related sulfurtransferase
MNTITKILTLLFFVGLLTSNQYLIAQDGAPKLSPSEFELQSKKKKKNVILDIRTPEETAEGHIEGATFIDFLGGDFEQEISKLNKKRTYFVYCRSAKRTIPATEKMMEMGFKNVYMLEGGLNNWMEKGKPVEVPEK